MIIFGSWYHQFRSMTCLFCGSPNLKLLFEKKFHPLAKWHGHFNLYQCLQCGSALTFPLPTVDQLTALYGSFKGGMMPGIRELRDEYPLTKWYNQCIDNAFHYAQKDIKSTQIFNWIDLGAGNGELAKLMTARFPMSSGVGTDFHDKPAALSTSGIK